MGEEEKIKNLLIVGYINCGKSTLANVLCDNQSFDENESTVRNSKDFQEDFFDWDGKKYHVVDIIVSNENLHSKIEQVIKTMPEGISQVLFVVDQRLTKEEIKPFKDFRNAISKIDKYTTIVRTKFENFKNEREREKDREDLYKLIKKISKRVHIVHVDNPPTHIYKDVDDVETIKIHKKRRSRSRNILLDHLNNVCKEDYCKLDPETIRRRRTFF